MQSSCVYLYFFVDFVLFISTRLSSLIFVFRFSKYFDVHEIIWRNNPCSTFPVISLKREVILAANKCSESPSKLPEKLPDNMRLLKAFWSDQRCCWCIALSNAASWCPKCHLKDKKAINLCKMTSRMWTWGQLLLWRASFRVLLQAINYFGFNYTLLCLQW